MKKLLFFLLAFLSVPAFAEVSDYTLFDFTKPKELNISPAIQSWDGSFDDQGVQVTSKVITSKDIQISFTLGIGQGGVYIPRKSVTIDGKTTYYYVLEMRRGSTIKIRTTNGCELDSVKFTGSTGSLTSSSTGLYYDKIKMWTPKTSTDTVVIENGAVDTGIQTIEVYYKKPSKPLNFVSSNPSAGSEVPTFNSMTLDFNLAINSSDVNTSGITLSGPGIQTPVAMSASVHGSSVSLSTGITYTAYGDYTVNVPFGAFKNSEGGTHESLSIPFRVNPKRDILTWSNVSPTPGKVNQLPETIDVAYKEFVSVPANSMATVYKDGVKQFTAPISLTEGNTKSVTIAHTRGVITEEGVWTFEVPEQAIYNGMMGNAADERWNPTFTLTYTVESAEAQELALARQLKSMTDNGNYGYPLSSSEGYTALSTVINKGKDATVDEIKEAMGKYYMETNVKMPAAGKWYRIAGVNDGGNIAYLTYANQKVELKSSYTSADAFLAVAGNGGIEFKTKDERYLTVLGNPSGFEGFTYPQSGKATQLTVAKLAVENADSTKIIGKFSISGWLGRNGNDEDLGNSTAAISYPSLFILASPTDVTYFSSATSSAFIFEETTEPSDPTSSIQADVTFGNNLKGIEIDNAGDEVRLVVHNVQNAEILNGSLPYFEKQHQIGNPERITTTTTILTKVENSFYDFYVNTTGLEAGEYLLYVPAETFSYTPTSEYSSVVGTLATLSITIKGSSVNPGGGDDPNPGGGDDPNPGGGDDPNPGGGDDPNPGGESGQGSTDTDKPNFSYDYRFNVSTKMLMDPDVHADVVADVWLNDIVFYTDLYSSIVPNPDAVIQITNINGALVKTGHLTSYSNFRKEMPYPWLNGYIALKLVLDNPFQPDELKYLSGMYYVVIPREALGDTNFGKWLKNNSFTGQCLVNEQKSYPFAVNNKIIDILGIDEVNAADGCEQKIYDLTGRRLENMKKPGVYIVNGKKIMVK